MLRGGGEGPQGVREELLSQEVINGPVVFFFFFFFLFFFVRVPCFGVGLKGNQKLHSSWPQIELSNPLRH